jgi:hypothetical protein
MLGASSQADMYLTRALEEFHRSANGPDLWVPVSGLLRSSLLESAQAIVTAKNRRLHFLRGTVLFAALAIEAFANELLAELLESRDLEAVDRLEVPDKLLIGIRLGTGRSPLSRGAQPLQDVAALVKNRNRLVHPKPANGIAAWIQDVEPADEAAIGPRAAATAMLRVSETMVLCTALRKYPNLHAGTAKTILHHRALLDAHNARCGPKILDVPGREDQAAPPLWDQMQEALATGWGLRGGKPDATRATGEAAAGRDAGQLGDTPVSHGDKPQTASGNPPQPGGEVDG